MCAWKCERIVDRETESNKALGQKENKVGLEEIKKDREVCEIQASPF